MMANFGNDQNVYHNNVICEEEEIVKIWFFPFEKNDGK